MSKSGLGPIPHLVEVDGNSLSIQLWIVELEQLKPIVIQILMTK